MRNRTRSYAIAAGELVFAALLAGLAVLVIVNRGTRSARVGQPSPSRPTEEPTPDGGPTRAELYRLAQRLDIDDGRHHGIGARHGMAQHLAAVTDDMAIAARDVDRVFR